MSQSSKPYHLTVDPEAGRINAWEGPNFRQAFETARYQSRRAMETMVQQLLDAGRFAWAGYTSENTQVQHIYQRPPSDAVHR